MNNESPIVLGKVKKGSAGKPIVVVIIFLFIGSILLFIPTINNYFGDNKIIDLIKNGEIIDFFINHDNYVDKPIINNNKKEETTIEPLLINSKTILTGNDFTLTNFNLTTNDITFTINNSKNIKFDETNYYLVLTQDNKTISNIKLIDTKEKEYTFNFKEKLNSTLEVKGIIKTIRDNDYPNFIVSTDESGLGSLYCKKDNYKIEYILSNNKLIRIKETLEYIDNGNDYLTKFEEYNKIKNDLINNNQISEIIENYSGFIFTTDIDLTTFNNSYKIDGYYPLNTKTNKIHFEMNAKGFDCNDI